jgi:predicted small secreted protein
MARTIIQVFIAGSLALVAAACNTTEGFGEDLQSAGEEIEEEAQESSD